MRIATGLIVAGLLVVPALAGAEKGSQGKGHGGAAKHEHELVSPNGFDERQGEAARGWFVASHGRGKCPPGLAKKGTGCLPPGQAKKRYALGRPLDRAVRRVPPPPELGVRIGPPPHGYVYVMVDGDLVKLAVGTMMVVDAIQALVD